MLKNLLFFRTFQARTNPGSASDPTQHIVPLCEFTLNIFNTPQADDYQNNCINMYPYTELLQKDKIVSDNTFFSVL